MATYSELFAIQNDATLRNKIQVAVTVKAQSLLDLASPTANQVLWASNALNNPTQTMVRIMPYVLAANKSATQSQITGASDSAVQTNVDAAVDKLIAGGVVI